MLMGTLSVRENLQFSASLRLPKSYSWKDKWLVVEEVIKELRLTQCANTKVRTCSTVWPNVHLPCAHYTNS